MIPQIVTKLVLQLVASHNFRGLIIMKLLVLQLSQGLFDSFLHWNYLMAGHLNNSTLVMPSYMAIFKKVFSYLNHMALKIDFTKIMCVTFTKPYMVSSRHQGHGTPSSALIFNKWVLITVHMTHLSSSNDLPQNFSYY